MSIFNIDMFIAFNLKQTLEKSGPLSIIEKREHKP